MRRCAAPGAPAPRAAAAHAPAAARRRRPAHAARPDAALYAEAQQALATLKASPRASRQRPEWEKVVAALPPRGGPLPAERLLRRRAARAWATSTGTWRGASRAPRYEDDAVAGLPHRWSPSTRAAATARRRSSPSSRSRARRGDRKRVAEAGRAYLAAFPDARRAAAEVKALLQEARAACRRRRCPQPPPPGLAQVFNLRFWSGESSTRVVLDVEKQVPLQLRPHREPRPALDRPRRHAPAPEPDRPQLPGGRRPAGADPRRPEPGRRGARGPRLQGREGPLRSSTWRTRLRLVVDVRGAAAADGRAARAAGRPAVRRVRSDAAPTPPPSPVAAVARARAPAVADARRPACDRVPAAARCPRSRRPSLAAGARGATAAAAPRSSIEGTGRPRHRRRRRRAARRRPAARRRAEPAPPPPQANRAGSYSLARQLGLGARRIVIDAGHGGHDPGTIGRGGLQEKDLVLDVALRLREAGPRRAGRRGRHDPRHRRLHPARGAHRHRELAGAPTSSSPSTPTAAATPSARGIETYFLNFAQDPHAEAVAARENAISAGHPEGPAEPGEGHHPQQQDRREPRLRGLACRRRWSTNLRPRDPDVQDRGVHTAPFYVLIGANMPSVLAEIAFVSNPEEERLLRTPRAPRAHRPEPVRGRARPTSRP